MKKVGQVNNTRSTLKKFSDVANSKSIMQKLRAGSRSSLDTQLRLQAYSQATDNLEVGMRILRTRKQSSAGLGDLSGLQPNQFIDVTVSSMISSIIGFVGVERGMDSPAAKLPFVNTVATEDDSIVAPNIGPGTYLDKGRVQSKVDVTTNTASVSYVTGSPLVPGQVKITIIRAAGGSFQAIDDANGNLIAPPSLKLLTGTVDYSLGSVDFSFATADQLINTDTYTIEVTKDLPKDPTNRIKSDLSFYDLIANPEVIVTENNFITDIVANKSMNIDMGEVNKKRAMEEYVKLMNKQAVDAISYGYVGNSYEIDLSAYSIATNTFESYLNLFAHGLNQVDTRLTDKSYKSVNASSYLVGRDVANLFKSMDKMGSFVRNTEMSFIEDLLGWYNGIPVVKSHNIPADVGYAVHKTSDGQMAPTARGIFLPVNDLPQVANFNNPSQTASGIYSYEGTRLLTAELLQKFTVKAPTNISQ